MYHSLIYTLYNFTKKLSGIGYLSDNYRIFIAKINKIFAGIVVPISKKILQFAAKKNLISFKIFLQKPLKYLDF
ncbi:hypothetical protein [Rickettsia endosymbiont of Cantharis rufa]|uniref:hypothetical protein n=1 Tax=Rickettsia endosymbiont of Cantharis rufa TaxID=3066248 RepID=UPI0031334D80